jgi:hypothetical protein
MPIENSWFLHGFWALHTFHLHFFLASYKLWCHFCAPKSVYSFVNGIQTHTSNFWHSSYNWCCSVEITAWASGNLHRHDFNMIKSNVTQLVAW